MTLEMVGGHFLHPDRNLHGRKTCSVEVVQMDTPLPGYDRLAVQGRMRQLRSKGNVDVAVRLDYASQLSFPPDGDETNLRRWLDWSRSRRIQITPGRVGSSLATSGTSRATAPHGSLGA